MLADPCALTILWSALNLQSQVIPTAVLHFQKSAFTFRQTVAGKIHSGSVCYS
jgi:hypothetical protein